MTVIFTVEHASVVYVWSGSRNPNGKADGLRSIICFLMQLGDKLTQNKKSYADLSFNYVVENFLGA